MADYYRYVNRVRNILLGAGEEGITQHELNQKVRTPSWTVTPLYDLLTLWESKQYVQSFTIRPVGSTRNAKLWRATTKLRDEWSTLTEFNERNNR